MVARLLTDSSGVSFESPEREAWQSKGVCTRVDPDIPFRDEEQAKRNCGVCIVSTQCLAYALAIEKNKQRHGVWGGLTALERSRLQKRLDEYKGR